MERIILISCVSKKLPYKARAKDIYVSPLFKLNLKYAQQMMPDRIFIISAEYGLLSLETEIKPYDLTLNKMSAKDIKRWAIGVLHEIERKTDKNNDEFIFLAGERYRKYLIPAIKNYKIPLEGLSIGKQLQYLKRHTIS
jgi:hypothetical protein